MNDYFEVLPSGMIRIKGTHVGIESVLAAHLYQKQTPEQLESLFPMLTHDQIQASLELYAHQQALIDAYLGAWLTNERSARRDPTWQPALQIPSKQHGGQAWPPRDRPRARTH